MLSFLLRVNIAMLSIVFFARVWNPVVWVSVNE